MYAEKFELLETKIRETAVLITRLRQEKRHLQQENAQLRERLKALEDELYHLRQDRRAAAPDLDSLLQQIETLREDDETPQMPDPVTLAIQELAARTPKGIEEYLRLGSLYEKKGELDRAIEAYQRLLECDEEHLETIQRLAFLLEKLNRDAEASPLWDKIWTMHEARSAPEPRRLH